MPGGATGVGAHGKFTLNPVSHRGLTVIEFPDMVPGGATGVDAPMINPC